MVAIKNVVATAHLGCRLDLEELERTISMSLYTPKTFSGLLIRITSPVVAHCQVYANGKITVNGGRSVKQSMQILEVFAEKFRRVGYKIEISDYKVVNIIATTDTKQFLRLEDLTYKLGVMYHPELFSGLAVRLTNCTAVLFHSGKINFLGAKSELDIEFADVEIRLRLGIV